MSAVSSPSTRERSWRAFLRRAMNSDSSRSSSNTIIDVDQDFIRCAVIYGGCTPLGRKTVAVFKEAGWWVASVDMSLNPHADANIMIMSDEDAGERERTTITALRKALGPRPLDFLFCAIIEDEVSSTVDELVQLGGQMWQDRVMPAMICASIAKHLLNKNGILVLMAGNSVDISKTNEIAYIVANSAVQQLARCLASPGSEFPKLCHVVCLLPIRLQTLVTRSLSGLLEEGDFTPLAFVTDLFMQWVKGSKMPKSGCCLHITTKNFNTECVVQKGG